MRSSVAAAERALWDATRDLEVAEQAVQVCGQCGTCCGTCEDREGCRSRGPRAELEAAERELESRAALLRALRA